MRTALMFAALVAWFLALAASASGLAPPIGAALGVSDLTGAALAGLAALLLTLAAFAGSARLGLVRGSTGQRDATIVAVLMALLWADLLAPQSKTASLFSWEGLPHLGLDAVFAAALIPLFRRVGRRAA